MFRIHFGRHIVPFLFLALLLVISSACNASSVSTPNTQPSLNSNQQATHAGTESQNITLEQDINYGPGPFDIVDTKTGLSDLSSYTARLVITFDGTQDGNAVKWSKSYTMLAITNPQARQWTIEKSGNGSGPTSVFMAETGGLDYERRGQDLCTANLIPEGNELSRRLDPASFLTGVVGAEETGSETVNGVDAKHYTFDQRALGEDGLTESTGELWVAAQGGYIVKYVLTRKGKADFFGEGIEGTQTLDYELTDVNKDASITLPDDCPPGLVDAPILPDAANVSNAPGRLEYQTSSSIADAAAFYQQQIPGKGWTLNGDPAVTDKSAFLNYQQKNRNMLIFISVQDGKTIVTITMASTQ